MSIIYNCFPESTHFTCYVSLYLGHKQKISQKDVMYKRLQDLSPLCYSHKSIGVSNPKQDFISLVYASFNSTAKLVTYA